MKPFYLPDDRAFLRYIEIPGDDPPLLWLHGWQCSATGELMPAAVQAPLRGRRSLMIDFLGHGYSDKPLGFGYGVEDHARTIVALIDALGLRECGLVGHSMGGAIAVHVATARATVVSLLIMAEGNVGPEGGVRLGGQTEDQFVERGFSELVEAHSRKRRRSRTASEPPISASLGWSSLARSIARPFPSNEGLTHPFARSCAHSKCGAGISRAS